jgi:vitamin B12 transporter
MKGHFVKRITIIIGTLLLLPFGILNFPTYSQAEGTVENLESIEITSNRLKTSVEQYAGSATVITEEEIKRSGKIHVGDILRDALGVDLRQSGPIGTTSTLFLRGANSDSTLVMIDGVQVNSNTLGSFNFSDLNVDNVQQIEILRGPQSTLWGSDAVGGVINIITKKGRGKPSTYASFEGGSFSTFKETIGASGQEGRMDYSVTASRTDSAGFSAKNLSAGATENDGYENTTLSARAGANLEGDLRVDFITRYSSSNVDIDSTNDDITRQSGTKTFNISLPINKQITDRWDITFRPSYFYEVARDAQATKEDAIYSRNITLELQNNIEINENVSTVFGMEYQRLAGHNVLQNFKHDNHNYGFFMQARMNLLEAWSFTGGFRKDLLSEFEDPLTYRFEGAYRIASTSTKIHTAYSTGFKAPTFNQQFFPNFGRAGLKPEESKGWEAGVQQGFLDDRVKIGFTYFETRFTNLLVTPPPTFALAQVGSAKTNGTETEIRAQLPYHSQISINHSWLEARDGNGTKLPNRSKHRFSTQLSKDFGKDFNLLVGLRLRSRAGAVEPFKTVRLAARYQVTSRLKLTARIENLFDEDYEEVDTFGTAGASGYAGFVYDF